MTSRTLLAAFALASVGATAAAQTPPGCATVEVANVRPQQGFLMVAAFVSAETYAKTPVTSLRLPAAESTMTFQLCGLAGPTVALRVFQDLDGDGKMGQNLLGMPTEPWGSSGTPGAFGPSWETGKVTLDGSPIAVRMSS